MSNSMYDFVCVLIHVNHYHPWFPFPQHLLFDHGRFDSIPLIFHVCTRCISTNLVNGRVLLKDCSLVFYYPFPSKLSRRLWNPKQVYNSRHLRCHLLVSLCGVLNQGIEYYAYFLGKNMDNLMVTFVRLLP